MNEAAFFQSCLHPNQWAWWSLPGVNGVHAERTCRLVIAHVDQPEIPIVMTRLPGNRRDDVRIDCDESRVDDFKVNPRMPFVQQDLEHSRPAECRIRITQRCGFSKHEDSVSTSCFRCPHQKRSRLPRQRAGKETPPKTRILHERALADQRVPNKKIGLITKSENSLQELSRNKENERGTNHGNRSEVNQSAVLQSGGAIISRHTGHRVKPKCGELEVPTRISVSRTTFLCTGSFFGGLVPHFSHEIAED